ncbi:MAG TPA: DUF4126 domain-containing protein [Blastocatellia bacterium]|jgi:uncharacterized membrane protein|nr:DUF4126 domain-containing protein [Blastocatellia bacterium]
MPSNGTRALLKAIGIGVIAGMRSMSAPALVSNHLVRTHPKGSSDTPLKVLAYPKTATLLKGLALGEMIVDKLPVAPARIAPGPLAARIVSGALCGGVLCAAEGGRADIGAVAGGLAAIAGAYGFYHLRRNIGEESSLPDPLLGLAEDAVVIKGGLGILGESKPS